MRYVAVLIGLIAMLAFVGCGDDDPVSSVSEEGIAAPAGKLTISGDKAGGFVGRHQLLAKYRDFSKLLNVHDLESAFAGWTEDVVYDLITLPEPFVGREAVIAYFETVEQGLPDFGTDRGLVLARGNILVVEHVFFGTHLGEFVGIPATGNSTGFSHIDIFDYEGDMVKRAATYADNVGYMMQLGVLPPGELPPLEPSFELPDAEATGLSPVKASTEFIARFNAHDLANLAKLFRPDADIVANGIVMDVSSYIGAVEHIYLAAHSDIRLDLVRTHDMGDGWVVNESLVIGTDDGGHEIFGWPVTGLPIALKLVTLERYDADGLVTYLHFYYDQMTEMVQLGLMPAP